MAHKEIEVKDITSVIVTTDGDAKSLSMRRGLQVAGPIAINIPKSSKVTVDQDGVVRHQGEIVGYYDGQGPQVYINAALLGLRDVTPRITKTSYTPLDLPKILKSLDSIGIDVSEPMKALAPFKISTLGMTHYSLAKK